VALAADRLDGDWLLVGGGAAATWFAPSRVTEDIDMIGLAGTQDERFALMNLALEASLPLEAVNSAADFFVRRIDGWREHLVLLHRGSRANIYRPDPTLFLLLKIGRLSEVDLGDCLALIDHCASSGETLDAAHVRDTIENLPASDDPNVRERRTRLLEQLG
jgi:hypothetical protein